MKETLLSVSYAVLPGSGEDSFAMGQDERGTFLCVTDGCGGLGSRRYTGLNNQTGAAIASQMAACAFSRWSMERSAMPEKPEEGKRLCLEMGQEFGQLLRDYADKHCAEEKTRIVGSMQSRLPTTLCAAVTQPGAARWCEVGFFWVGDSRGYVLDENGLHQCTQDHLRTAPDAFESLYRDMPLSRFLSADHIPEWSMRRMRAPLPSVVIVATDGAYGSLPTPMEFEMLLLNTLLSSRSWMGWEKKMVHQLQKIAQDDATVLMQPCGATDIEALKTMLAPRREALQRRFITPVRRRRGDVAYAREKWMEYRLEYDWTTGGQHERMDWRV